MVQVALKTRTAGTRPEARIFMPSKVGCICGVCTVHMPRGVPFRMSTCKVGTARHALQKSSEANCRFFVDAYQTLSPPSHACLSATVNASRHKSFPGNCPRWHRERTRKTTTGVVRKWNNWMRVICFNLHRQETDQRTPLCINLREQLVSV